MIHEKHNDITGLILAGGKSRRMGRDKAFLEFSNKPLLEPVITLFKSRFDKILLSGDRPERFSNYIIKVIPDIYPGSSLGGIHAGLLASDTEQVFVAPCDLPYPDSELLDHICCLKSNYDVIVPVSPQGYEPLYALYSKSCIEPIQTLLERSEFRIIDLFSMVKTLYIQGEELTAITKNEKAFLNINTPEEFERLTGLNLPDKGTK